VDGGELGYFDAESCENGEHRCFDESTVMEIVDEDTLEPITETGRTGKLLVTNLNRRLMPLIRYPTGDRAQWREPEGAPDRKFRLEGRSEEGARIGPATLYVQDVLKVIAAFQDEVHILNFQILLTHEGRKDRAVIRVVPREMPGNPEELARRIVERIYRERALLPELIEEDRIYPLSLEWCSAAELEHNPRSGKTKHIIDKRLEKG
jgi:phenylacetate-CoA ligase